MHQQGPRQVANLCCRLWVLHGFCMALARLLKLWCHLSLQAVKSQQRKDAKSLQAHPLRGAVSHGGTLGVSSICHPYYVKKASVLAVSHDLENKVGVARRLNSILPWPKSMESSVSLFLCFWRFGEHISLHKYTETLVFSSESVHGLRSHLWVIYLPWGHLSYWPSMASEFKVLKSPQVWKNIN